MVTFIVLIVFLIVVIFIIKKDKSPQVNNTPATTLKKQAPTVDKIQIVDSMFVNPKTGKFQHPRFNSPAGALITIYDDTERKYLESPKTLELESMTVNEYFDNNDGNFSFIIDIDKSLRKASKSILEPFGFLYKHFDDLEQILSDNYGEEEDDEMKAYPFDMEGKFEEELLNKGYLEKIIYSSNEEKINDLRDDLSRMLVSELNILCEKLNIETIKPKAKLTEKILQTDLNILSEHLPTKIQITDKMIDMLNELTQKCASDVMETIKSWHLTIKQDILEFFIDAIEETELLRFAKVEINIKITEE